MLTAGLLNLLALALSAAEPANAIKVGERLPELRGEFLTGREAVLPRAADARVTLLLLGFTYQSRFAVEAWTAKFRAQFEADPRVSFYEVPMIGGAARLARWFIDSGMRRGTPKADHQHVITVYGSTDVWKKRVRFAEPDAAYLILLDGSGKVAWLHRGAFEDGAFGELARKVAAMLGTH